MSDRTTQTTCDHSNTTFSFVCSVSSKDSPIRCDRCLQRVNVKQVKKSFAGTLEKVKEAMLTDKEAKP